MQSKQLAILKRMSAHLKGITPANGYAFDLTGKVARGRLVFGADQPLPFISIIEATRNEAGPSAAENDRKRHDLWPLLIQGWVEDDKQNPTDPGYELKAAVTKRLAEVIAVNRSNGNPSFPSVYMLGNLITSMTVSLGVVRPPDGQVSDKAWFYLPVTVGLSIDVDNPFVAS